jgi:hypothetical protein
MRPNEDAGVRLEGALAKGYSIQVPVDMATGELVLGTPAVLHRKLGLAP